MRQKSEVKDIVMKYLVCFKTQTNKSVTKVISNNGLQNLYKFVRLILSQKGIIHEKSCPYPPEQNERIERHNRTIIIEEQCQLEIT